MRYVYTERPWNHPIIRVRYNHITIKHTRVVAFWVYDAYREDNKHSLIPGIKSLYFVPIFYGVKNVRKNKSLKF